MWNQMRTNKFNEEIRRIKQLKAIRYLYLCFSTFNFECPFFLHCYITLKNVTFKDFPKLNVLFSFIPYTYVNIYKLSPQLLISPLQ